MITHSKLSQHLHCVCLLFLVEYTKSKRRDLSSGLTQSWVGLETCMHLVKYE